MPRLKEIFGDRKLKKVKKEKKEEEKRERSGNLKGVEGIEYEEDILKREGFLEFGATYVKPMTIRNESDIQKITKELNDGNIVLGNVTPIAEKDPGELRRLVEQVKGICKGIGGDIVGVGDSRILVTPANIKVYREK
ncbi:MAG: cell division protein SepF [Euryarchaeota archaeon]|nr:cell division protein SepF [Euryarchaeota archaeon]